MKSQVPDESEVPDKLTNQERYIASHETGSFSGNNHGQNNAISFRRFEARPPKVT
jgi:hypothetical protein